MDSSDSERSIVGISLPQWMKNKINDRYDLDQNTFSPPSEDDSFFYIRYAKSETRPNPPDNEKHGSTTFRPISNILEHHTPPCQQFIPAAKTTPRDMGMNQIMIDPPLGVMKSTGTDDGFYGIGAACGHSVVAVAHQMITGAKIQSRFVSPNCDCEQESATPPTDSMLRQRRNSKSLPSSPQISPKTIRKNPFFSNVIFGSSDNIVTHNQDMKQGWLPSFGRDSNSVKSSLNDLKIEEETSQSLAELSISPKQIKSKQKLARPRPSQLREMNFWSPTSM